MNLVLLAAELVAGFILLIKGADFFVEGSSSVAKMLRIPSLIIGMTIVAMGTSLPECAVSVTASLAQQNELAIANVVGSNIFNLMVVCGVCCLFCPLAVKKSTLLKEFPFSVAIALLLMGFGITSMVVGHLEGVILLIVFGGFILWMIFSALRARKQGEEVAEEEYETLPVWKCLIFMGLTIVAFGTSLPELVTSIVAARKKEVDMALGNVIGSNIFNILFVLGIAAAISPVAFTMENIIDIVILALMSVLVWIFAWSKNKLVLWEGAVMLLCYGGYFGYICLR